MIVAIGADPRSDRLIDRQFHRDMARGSDPQRFRPPLRIEKRCGLQHVVGDLDEIDLAALLRPRQHRIDIGLAADLDRALRHRRDPLDLRTRSEQARTEEASARNLAAPRQRPIRKIAGAMADRRDSLSDSNSRN